MSDRMTDSNEMLAVAIQGAEEGLADPLLADKSRAEAAVLGAMQALVNAGYKVSR